MKDTLLNFAILPWLLTVLAAIAALVSRKAAEWIQETTWVKAVIFFLSGIAAIFMWLTYSGLLDLFFITILCGFPPALLVLVFEGKIKPSTRSLSGPPPYVPLQTRLFGVQHASEKMRVFFGCILVFTGGSIGLSELMFKWGSFGAQTTVLLGVASTFISYLILNIKVPMR